MPELSVVMPSYNQCERLRLTLHSFLHQCCKKDEFEVVICDDGSNDDTEEVIAEFIAIANYQLKYVRLEHAGRAAARNQGIAASEGRYILFNDGDRAASNSLVRKHLDGQRHREGVLVGGIYDFYFTNLEAKEAQILSSMPSDFAELTRYAREYAYARCVGNLYDRSGDTAASIAWLSFMSGNVSVPRAALDAAGGFDENFTGWGFEHFELGYRLQRNGTPYRYDPTARNYHFAHRRDEGFYANGMRESFDYFYHKYSCEQVAMLRRFFTGELSLNHYETSCGDGSLLANADPIYHPNPIQF